MDPTTIHPLIDYGELHYDELRYDFVRPPLYSATVSDDSLFLKVSLLVLAVTMSPWLVTS